jgi:O-antigen ligase
MGTLLIDSNKVITWNRVHVLMLLFYSSILISTVRAYFPEVSWKYQDYFYTWLVIYFLFVFITNNYSRFLILFLIVILASFKMSLYGAKTWTLRGFAFTDWGLKGPPGFFENSGEYSIQMSVMFAMSYYLCQACKPHVSMFLYRLLLLLPITAAMSVLGANSRGAQLALLVQSYFIFLHGKASIRTVLLLAAVLALFYHFLPEEQLQRFETAGTDKTSEQRLLYWEHGYEMLNSHPAFGVGYFNFPPYYDKHYPQDVLYERAQLPHNILVQVGADLGYYGLIIYLSMIYSVFALSRKTRKLVLEMGFQQEDWRCQLSRGLSVGFLGFLIAGQFVSVVYYPFMWIQLGFVVSLYSIVRTDYARTTKLNRMI